ncbi:MAG TPA: trehalase family glycosidase [Patescibacteria group bacterium]|nr:trehalase family glycosidase [Patescibacteria group bacterium]
MLSKQKQILTFDQRLEALKPSAQELLLKNRRFEGEHQYTVPSPATYPYQWLWDSCFHAIVLTHFNAEDAKKELLSLVARQFPNGMIPHMIYWKMAEVIRVAWGTEGTSSITQPPLLAQAVERIWNLDHDKAFLENIYPHLYHFYNYLLTDRDPRHHHLIGIINPDESGEDNSPRFDIPLGMGPKQTLEENFQRRMELIDKNKDCKFDAPFCMKNFFWVKDVPYNAIMIVNLRALASLAAALGNADDEVYFGQQADEVALSMRARMFEDGLFWSTYGQDYKKIKVKTWAIFAPLIAKVLTQDEAEKLVTEYLFNPREFGARFGVPTVSKSEPSYDPKGFWRGPTWIAINWFIYHGLLNYNFQAAADRVRDASLRLVEASGFREQFHPDTGEGAGALEFTWGTLVLDMTPKINPNTL